MVSERIHTQVKKVLTVVLALFAIVSCSSNQKETTVTIKVPSKDPLLAVGKIYDLCNKNLLVAIDIEHEGSYTNKAITCDKVIHIRSLPMQYSIMLYHPFYRFSKHTDLTKTLTPTMDYYAYAYNQAESPILSTSNNSSTNNSANINAYKVSDKARSNSSSFQQKLVHLTRYHFVNDLSFYLKGLKELNLPIADEHFTLAKNLHRKSSDFLTKQAPFYGTCTHGKLGLYNKALELNKLQRDFNKVATLMGQEAKKTAFKAATSSDIVHIKNNYYSQMLTPPIKAYQVKKLFPLDEKLEQANNQLIAGFVAKHPQSKAHWYKKAAKQGNAQAMYALAVLWQEERDFELALASNKWLAKSATYGFLGAKQALHCNNTRFKAPTKSDITTLSFSGLNLEENTLAYVGSDNTYHYVIHNYQSPSSSYFSRSHLLLDKSRFSLSLTKRFSKSAGEYELITPSQLLIQ